VASFSWRSLGTEEPLFGAAFSRLERKNVPDLLALIEKTAVYIDGYNL
jgi:hypothetical protein